MGKSKKKKYLLKKLGSEHIYETVRKTGTNVRKSLADIVKDPPSMVVGRILQNTTMTIGKTPIPFQKGTELVMALGLYLSAHKSQQGGKIVKPSTNVFKNRWRKYYGQDLTNKSLLIWRFGGIGDLMFSQPLISYLKKTYPTAKIHFATAPDNMEVFKFWPQGLVDRIHPMPFDARLLDDTNYHLTFEGSIERCLEAHTVNAIDVFAKMAGLSFDPFDYPAKIIPDRELVLQLSPYIPPKTIVLQLRASSPIRTFSLEKAVELINILTDTGFNVGIIDSAAAAMDIQQFIAQTHLFRNPKKIMNLAILSKSLQHCVAILQNSCGAISTDSAITHLMAGLGKPIVGAYGPFRGDIRMRYYAYGDWVDSDTWNECGKCPCFFHESEFHLCPYLTTGKHPGCMENLDSDKIVQKFMALYERYEEKEHESKPYVQSVPRLEPCAAELRPLFPLAESTSR